MFNRLQTVLRKTVKRTPFLALLYRYFSHAWTAISSGPSAKWALASFQTIQKSTDADLNRQLDALDAADTITFVQVGSNDGKTGDPIYKYVVRSEKWNGVLVEPNPVVMRLLKQNYAGRQELVFAETIISARSKPVPFYYVDPAAESAIQDLSSMYTQLSGFSKEHIIRLLGPEIEPFVKCSVLQAKSLQGLIVDNGLIDLDLLHIDTEGADFQILKPLNLRKIRPKMIICEYVHLSFVEAARLVWKLQPFYELCYTETDLFAVSKTR